MAVNLALAGVGEMTLVDRDVVSLENLHRQPIYSLSDVGKSKAEVAAGFIAARVPGVKVRYRAESIDDLNSLDILGGSDVGVDCLDNVPARLALNSACVKRELPLVHTGGIGWEASEGVFWSPKTACLECLFPRRPAGADTAEWDALPDCEQVGALGAITGLVASLGAMDAIKLLIGLEPASLGRMLVWDGRNAESHLVEVMRREDCDACGRGTSRKGMRTGSRSKGAGRSIVELCGGNEFYIGGAFSPRSFAKIGRGLLGRSAAMGESIIQARVGEAEVSIFRSGGLLVRGVSSPEGARGVARALGMDV
jgi:adenylyltransferase/sulfurtransferase